MDVQISHIVKTFGKVRANDDISMTFQSGHIYAVLGENGAGKSTLMKILSGFQPPDSGQIVLDGQPVVFASPADALRVGIGMLHQDVLDVPGMTVLDNFILARGTHLLPDRHRARVELSQQADKLGFDLNPDAYVDSLTIGERQQLELVRLLSLGAKVLILDEPTTGISTDQKEVLFNSLRRLAHTESVTVILVSHKLEDVNALCDSVVVLRQGQVTGSADMPSPTATLIEMMFGKDLPRSGQRPGKHAHKGLNTVLSVKALSVPGRRVSLKDVYLDVERGEVVGLAGLDGSGQRGLLRACAGLEAPTAGWLYLEGRDVTHLNYHDRVGLGVAYTPAGRLEEGLVAGLTLTEHVALVSDRGTWVHWNAARHEAKDKIEHYSIRGTSESRVETLSGGNQQRALMALLPQNLKLLLLESPTRGLDVESARWVWRQLLARREQGAAIIFISPDLDEIIEYSDRVVVFFGGRATLIDDPSKTSMAELGRLIGGVQS
ncbi:MAG TPA: ATP-binding cassette domain-containing protein [Aggregatilineales bacterium]|nr:ATP-binding cassette domain-containing protein [Aggregatilineales bacterium]